MVVDSFALGALQVLAHLPLGYSLSHAQLVVNRLNYFVEDGLRKDVRQLRQIVFNPRVEFLLAHATSKEILRKGCLPVYVRVRILDHRRALRNFSNRQHVENVLLD